MRIERWLMENTHSLSGKTVAITGSTGGLGREICRYLLSMDADLLLLDRNAERSQAWRSALLREYPRARVTCLQVELSDWASVKEALTKLQALPIDVFLHNAGAYSIPRRICDTGYDNVFQINFLSPYYMIRTLLPVLRERGGHVVAVGSIAHRYSATDPADVDFSTRRRASHVYGNAKRYLMLALIGLFEGEERATLSVTHPGISFTNITAHYPKLLFALIKHPMKWIFMKPKVACLSVIKGIFSPCRGYEWIGPGILDVWGKPKKKPLRSVNAEERKRIYETAERICRELEETT
ncbi:MAG: SDR family NAD(P)-dependent oxidoreductase [Clostridia bacterium]|nr:SDR family NAD(P)-dependent oxidoreductase [Clostridia bacterium]